MPKNTAKIRQCSLAVARADLRGEGMSQLLQALPVHRSDRNFRGTLYYSCLVLEGCGLCLRGAEVAPGFSWQLHPLSWTMKVPG